MSSWLSPADLPNIVYKKKFSGAVQRGQKSYKISFEPGQRIFVLLSPDDLPLGSTCEMSTRYLEKTDFVPKLCPAAC